MSRYLVAFTRGEMKPRVKKKLQTSNSKRIIFFKLHLAVCTSHVVCVITQNNYLFDGNYILRLFLLPWLAMDGEIFGTEGAESAERRNVFFQKEKKKEKRKEETIMSCLLTADPHTSTILYALRATFLSSTRLFKNLCLLPLLEAIVEEWFICDIRISSTGAWDTIPKS